MPRLMLTILLALGPIAHAEIVSPAIPDGLGVNIHFTDPKPGELRQIADAGFKIVRMDFDWNVIEAEKDKYDFAAYDRLVKACNEHGLRILFILDYVNKHYDDARSPDTDQGRAGFARWAAASVQHFKGHKILWEMYNEPNIHPFWRPKPNPDDYVKLALATARAIKEVAPEEIQIGPACSGVDLPFLETCFKAGLLEYWSAVSVHPYRQQDPETVAHDYRKLRLMLHKYAPKDKAIPILSGEWGYSSVWSGFDDDRQGRMLPRQWLTNIANDVPISIWYDWHDDGPDPKEPEHHFGTVNLDYTAKPAYVAAKTLTSQLGGHAFCKRLAFDSPDDHVLLFTKGEQTKIVAWTTAEPPRRIQIPGGAKAYTVVSHRGRELPALTSHDSKLEISLTDTPQYIAPDQHDDCLAAVALVGRPALEVSMQRDQALAGFAITGVERLTQPLDQEELAQTLATRERLRLGLATSADAISDPDVRSEVVFGWNQCPIDAQLHRVLLRQHVQVAGRRIPFAQEVFVRITDPLLIRVFPRVRDVLPVRIENPSGKSWRGQLAVYALPGSSATIEPIHLSTWQKQLDVIRSAPPEAKDGSYLVSVGLFDELGQAIVKTKPHRCRPIKLSPEQFEIAAEGDPAISSTQSFKSVDAPAGLPVNVAPAMQIVYRFDPGWKYLCLKPREHQDVNGKPAHLGVWIKGDGSGNIPRMRFVDSTGQTFQPDADKLTYTDWRYVEFPLDNSQGGHWGGANNGKIHYPIRLETILLIDSAARQKTEGTVYLSSPTLIYTE